MMLNGLWRDLGHAVRSLAKAPAFTAVCVVSLGIGMTPVIAIPFVSRVSTLPPPGGVDTTGLVELVTAASGPRPFSSAWSYADFEDLEAASTGLRLIPWGRAASEVMFPPSTATTTVSSTFVQPDYFEAVGVALLRGGGFDATAADPLAKPVVVLGHAFWQSRFGADPDIVGKTVTIDGVAHVVTGVAPALFTGHMAMQGTDLFLPLGRHPNLRPGPEPAAAGRGAAAGPADARTDRSKEWLYLHGRLQEGVSAAQAGAAVAAATARLAKAYPATNEFKSGVVAPYDPLGVATRSQFRVMQAVGFTLTGMVLLVVALNVSGMMQVRSAMRERELSIRQAIGATRGRLTQYLLTEALVIACGGGALASLVLFNLPSLLSAATGKAIPPQFLPAFRIDASILGIAFGLCVITSLVFGWLPAVRFSRPALLSSLKDDTGSGGQRVGRVHRVTAALQVAIAVPLLVMSGQSIDRVRATASHDLGFATEQLYAAPLNLDRRDARSAGAEMRRLSEVMASSNGVASVTVADGLPLDFRYRMTSVSLQADANMAARLFQAHVTRVGDGYFETMGIPLVRGRRFTGEDRAGAEPVVIVSKPLADRLAPDGDVLGKRLVFGADPKARQTLTIVGITGDFPTSQMSTEREQVLLPLAQHPGVRFDSVAIGSDIDTAAHVMLIVRRAGGAAPDQVTTALVRVAHELDPEFTDAGVVTGAWLRRNSMNDFLTQSAVAGAAGGVVLLLAALGIYGVVGLMVATRTREIAIRAALGASRGRVIAMVIRDVVRLVLPGVVVGMVLTIVLNRINAENMGIALTDLEPLAYVLGAALAVLVAVFASLPAARRASTVPPMVAMKSE